MITPRRKGFTLIELLVVISIIGVLASLTVGLSKLAGRKGKEARIRGDMAKLVAAIEGYKSNMGFYPPDHRERVAINGVATDVSIPSPNQLYYELSGTVYNNNNTFSLRNSAEQIQFGAATAPYFGAQTSGFSNSARDPRDIKSTEEFKATQYNQISLNPPISVLSVPAKATAQWRLKDVKGAEVNPWLYVSTSPTNNPERFDLWTEAVIGKQVVRFSNWEKDPVVLQ